MSSSRDTPLVSQVSVTMARSASSSLKQVRRELIFKHRDLAFVLMMVNSEKLSLLIVFIVSSAGETSGSPVKFKMQGGLPVLSLS